MHAPRLKGSSGARRAAIGFGRSDGRGDDSGSFGRSDPGWWRGLHLQAFGRRERRGWRAREAAHAAGIRRALQRFGAAFAAVRAGARFRAPPSGAWMRKPMNPARATRSVHRAKVADARRGGRIQHHCQYDGEDGGEAHGYIDARTGGMIASRLIQTLGLLGRHRTSA
jgi:hypothetical protein